MNFGMNFMALAVNMSINYPSGWFNAEQVPTKTKEEMVDVYIPIGKYNGLQNYAAFTVPVSLNIKEKYGVINTAELMYQDGWRYYER